MVQQNNGILLINIPPWDFEKPPLGVACLATYLKSIGVSVEVMDINIEIYHKSPENIKSKWSDIAASVWLEKEFAVKYDNDFQKYVDRIISYGYKILGFSINTTMSIGFLKRLILQIKRADPDKIIVVGGPGCFFSHTLANFRGDFVNYFVIGKGEFALEWLLTKLSAGDSLKNDEKCRINKEENGCLRIEGIKEYPIDSLPLPTFEEFNLKLYTRAVLPVRWSQGCIRSCAFCLDKIFSGDYSPGSVERVVAGIKFYIDKYGIKEFYFIDNLINGDLRLLVELCDRIIKEDLSIVWNGQIAVRADMDKAIFVKLKMAKCKWLNFGVESFSDKVLLAMNKGFKAENVVQNMVDAKAAGLNVAIFIIVGFPGEEEADFEETTENIKRYHEYIDSIANLNLCSISFGTDMSNNLEKYNIIAQEQELSQEFWLKWHTKDNKNNFEIRLKRLLKLRSILEEFKIPFKDNYGLIV
ncbi:MAG: radical SAM protein [Candidatus Omnitrophota bacterium]|nr:radical SAM protein [Candidatus Omnitrophota bacterium]